MCEAKHACLHTDKDAVSRRLWASLPRACRTRAVLTGESRQTRKGCLSLRAAQCQPQKVGLLCPTIEASKQSQRTSPPKVQKHSS